MRLGVPFTRNHFNPCENLDAEPFKVPCEQNENIERLRVNELSGQVCQPVENSCERVTLPQLDCFL